MRSAQWNVANTPENVVRSFTTLIRTILDLPLANVDEALQNQVNSLTRSAASLAAEGRLEDGEVSPFRAECTARLEELQRGLDAANARLEENTHTIGSLNQLVAIKEKERAAAAAASAAAGTATRPGPPKSNYKIKSPAEFEGGKEELRRFKQQRHMT